MACTTILVGKNATYDGSTMVARNEDSPAGQFTPKKFIVVNPQEQPAAYQSVISKVHIDLPVKALRYTAVPNALDNEGIWGEAGINEENVAMSETETITSNPRVLGADPLVEGGIGEEDLLTIVLPYIHSAREGVVLLGKYLEMYGTYEMNGIAFSDVEEIWWLESIGGHHWMAKRVPDDSYVVMPNQLGIDSFDFKDAYGEQKDHMCSKDLVEFIETNHLDLRFHDTNLYEVTDFDARAAFGSHDDADHTYNTPRAWDIQRYLNPTTSCWYGQQADYTPESDTLPWSRVPEKKITPEDVKIVLSRHFQGTAYDPYGKGSQKNIYRSIGVNRTNFVSLLQLRPYLPKDIMAVQWIAMGSNVFNAFVPFYANVTKTPDYFSNTGQQVTTENFYWTNRIIGALADAHYHATANLIERYQNTVHAKGNQLIKEFDQSSEKEGIHGYLEQCNDVIANMVQKETDALLEQVLYTASCHMKNGFARSDA